MKTHFGSEPKQNIQHENLDNFHLIPNSERECSKYISVCLVHGINTVTAQRPNFIVCCFESLIQLRFF